MLPGAAKTDGDPLEFQRHSWSKDVAHVWRSWPALGYLTDVKTFTSRYERSLRQAIAIKRKVGDRLIVFELDAMLCTNDKTVFIDKTFYAPLGLSLTPFAREHLEETTNRNSAERRGATLVDDPAMTGQMDKLSQSPKIRDYKAALLASSEP